MFHTSLVRKQLFRNIFICFTIFILFLNPYQSFCLAQIDSDKYHFLHTHKHPFLENCILAANILLHLKTHHFLYRGPFLSNLCTKRLCHYYIQTGLPIQLHSLHSYCKLFQEDYYEIKLSKSFSKIFSFTSIISQYSF